MHEAQALVRAMTLEEKAAQMILVGFAGTELPDQYARWIERQGVGGLILFSRNVQSPEQTRALTQAAQAAAARSRQGVPLVIAIDQEGGTVVRMGQTSGYTHFPGNMALGAADDESITYRAARAMAAEMRAVGVNWNFAPVLDVNNNPANPVIGVRSYGSTPDLVTRHGVAAVRGYQEGGVAACGKHFPGHGDTEVDSHLALPAILHDRARLEAVEFLPFRAAAQAGLDSLMTAHVFFPALEHREGLPATLSHRVLTGLLRETMGFDGVICTDCLEMKAIAENYSPEQTAVLAVEAGADVLLISHTWDVQMAMYEALVDAVRSGRISEERIGASAARIVRMKQARAMGQASPEAVGTPEHLALAQEVARRAVTVVWGAARLLRPERLTVILPRAGQFSQAEDALHPMAPLLNGLASAGVRAEIVDCPLDMAGVDPVALARRVGPSGTAVFGVLNVHRYPQQAEVAAGLIAAGCRLVAVARRLPSDLKFFPGALAAVAMYDDSPAMQQAVAELLAGQLQPSGKLPVQV